MVRSLIILVILFGALSIGWPWMLRHGLGQMPGDIRIEQPGIAFYLPAGSGLLLCVALSLALTLLSWLFRR